VTAAAAAPEAQRPPLLARPVTAARYAPAYLTAVALVAASFLRFGATGHAVVAAGFCCVLVLLSVVDFERHILPNRIVLPAAAAVLATQIALAPDRWVEWIVAAVGASLFFFVLAMINPAGLGMGDVKLALLLGAMLGRDVIFALLLGSIGVAVVGLFLLARHGSAARKRALPFGPFLAAGAVIALFLGGGGA
jgi:leader peptidase (prepilin peptidase)/N-methyltransferase